MIPDFPVQKAKLQAYWQKYLDAKHKQLLGIWSNVPTLAQQEGHRWHFARADGSVDESEYESFESIIEINRAEVPNLTPIALQQRFDDLARAMADNMQRSLFETLTKGIDGVGHTVDAKGKPLTKDHFLQALEQIDIEFDKDGEPILPSLIMNPGMYESMKGEFEHWESDPAFTARQERIIELKRIAWRDRESRRKLVD